jgi:hypothetical protein
MDEKKEYIERGALKQKKVYSLERHEYVVPVAEIDWMPAADVVDVRHGEWIAKDCIVRSPFARNYYCSVCKYEPLEAKNYCPNCGAKMDGERNEQT